MKIVKLEKRTNTHDLFHFHVGVDELRALLASVKKSIENTPKTLETRPLLCRLRNMERHMREALGETDYIKKHD